MDKKYVLACNLPFAMKGTEVKFVAPRHDMRFPGIYYVGGHIEYIPYGLIIQTEIESLIENDIIKESKPREWWMTKTGNATYLAFDNIKLIEEFRINNSGEGIIHVREIIDGN